MQFIYLYVFRCSSCKINVIYTCQSFWYNKIMFISLFPAINNFLWHYRITKWMLCAAVYNNTVSELRKKCNRGVYLIVSLFMLTWFYWWCIKLLNFDTGKALFLSFTDDFFFKFNKFTKYPVISSIFVYIVVMIISYSLTKIFG